MNLRKWLVEKFGSELRIEQLEDLHTFILTPSTNGLTPPEESQQ
jgi:hypothetical protein